MTLDETTIELRRIMAGLHGEAADQAIDDLDSASLEDYVKMIRRLIFQPTNKDVFITVLDRFRQYPVLYFQYVGVDGKEHIVKWKNHPRTSRVWKNYIRRMLVGEGSLLYSQTLKDEVSMNAFILRGRKQTTSRRRLSIAELLK